MQIRRILAIGSVLVSCAMLQCVAHAQVLHWGEEYAKRTKAAEQVSPLSDDAFGDQVSLFNGSVSFSATDIAIPGNSALAVELTRTYDTQDVSWEKLLGDWDLDVPRLAAVHPAGRSWAPAQRCSTVAPPPKVDQGQYVFSSKDYWSGTQLHARNAGGTLLAITDDPKLVRPSSGHTFKWVTKDGWFFSCLSQLQSGQAGEGFLGHAPDGTRYYFDWMVERPYPRITKKSPSTLQWGVVNRVSVRLYVTRIEDRFGNWVKYEWSGDRLIRIHSKDGRQIDLSYDASGRLDSASANGRTWRYAYSAYNASNDLLSVTNPDSSRWTYARGGTGTPKRIDYVLDPQQQHGKYERDDGYRCWHVNKLKPQAPMYTVTHPAGATATFTFRPTRHGRTNVPYECLEGVDDDHSTDFNWRPLTSELMSLHSKRITGPGLDEATYWYEYTGLEAGYRPKDPATDEITGATPPPHYKYVTVTSPDGSRVVNRFGKDYGLNEGQLLRVDVYGADGKLLRATVNTYVSAAEAEASPFPAYMGQDFVFGSSSLSTSALRPLRVSTVNQQATQFSTRIAAFDAHARSVEVREWSSLGYDRTRITAYHDDRAAWVLGQVASVTDKESGKQISSTAFNGQSLPWKLSSFGKLQSTLTYHPLGTLATVTDGNGHTTALSGWKRGIPQRIDYVDGTFKAASVNDDGALTSVTNENGHTTSYQYDSMGRLSQINHPGNWNPTTFSFVRIGQDEYGISAGHWRHLVSTGNRRKYTYFDGLWRPLLTREYDSADVAETQRFQRFAYDHAGRTTFASYPSANSDAVTGAWAYFDALGRPTSSSQDSELGLLTTLTAYLPGFRTQVTNPRQFTTTTSYQAFGAPDTGAPVLIQAPQGVTTRIERDDFGKTSALIRGGN